MANFDTMIPFILFWEVSYRGCTIPANAYAEAAKKGYHNIPGDPGGPTMCGVTLATYTTWCRAHGLPSPDVAALKKLPYEHWRAIAKQMFWDRCRADQLRTDAIAWVLVDWTWTAGANGIKGVQQAAGVTADGVIGPKTIAALNGGDQRALFDRIQDARRAYYRRIAVGAKAKFLRGWLNRTDAITFTDLRIG